MPELVGQDFVELIDRVYRSGEACEASNARLLLRAAAPRAGTGRALPRFRLHAAARAGRRVSGVLLHGVDVTERTRANALAVGQRGALELAVTDAPLGDVLDVLARTAEDYSGGAALASVQLVSSDGQHLRHAAAPSLPLEFQLEADAVRIGPLAGAAGAAAWRAEAVASRDIATDPLWEGQRELALAHGLRGCRALPILAPSGAVLGAFSLYYRDAGHLAPQEEAALALLANTASLVIGQRHEAAERQAAEHRSRAILESMSEGFIAVDGEWRITYANGAAEDVTRRAPRRPGRRPVLGPVSRAARRPGQRGAAAQRAGTLAQPHGSLRRAEAAGSRSTPSRWRSRRARGKGSRCISATRPTAAAPRKASAAWPRWPSSPPTSSASSRPTPAAST
jgi:PAS domain-containing protein